MADSQDQGQTQIQEVIENLLYSYSTKEDTPSSFEVMSIEMALPYVSESMDTNTLQSYMDWINRHKERIDSEMGGLYSGF